MATFVEFESLSEDLAEKVQNLDTDTLKWYLTNTAPSAAADAAIADLPTEISNGNGYTTGGFAADVATSRTGGTTTITLSTNSELTSSTGNVGPFRYACLVNSTASRVVGYLDHGASITLDGTLGDIYRIPSGSLFTIN
jgi:hypothetical protein